jgi:hypothetical protein
MKLKMLFIIFLVIGSILLAGYFTKSIAVVAGPATPINDSAKNSSLLDLTNSTTFPQNPVFSGTGAGQVLISIGEYNARLPVFIDGIQVGNVSNGTPLKRSLTEGTHEIRICTENLCESAKVDIQSALDVTIDFGERMSTDVPFGSLNISIGRYPVALPVVIDGINAGMVFPNQVLNRTLSTGDHTVRFCFNETCLNETVTIQPSAVTVLDFGERLEQDIPLGSIRVSIGGYNAELPVSVDNSTVGNVSNGKPLDLMVSDGNHTVGVCVGKICEQENVQVRFAKQTVVDFSERLKTDAEFPAPTARITTSFKNGATMVADVEFINPDLVDHTITATVSCSYTYTDSQNLRRLDLRESRITTLVKANSRKTQRAVLSLGGSNIIADAPTLVDITTQ